MALPQPPNLHAKAGINPGVRGHSDKVISDLKALRKHLLLPIDEIRSMRWVEDKKLIGILLLGLFPIAALTVFQTAPSVVYWCFGFYFSVLWALFFFHFFTPAGATRTNAVIAFLGTGLISMAILFTLLTAGFEAFRDPYLASPDFFIRVGANILTIGVPEEICKLLVVLYLLRSGPSLPSVPTMVFYGMMSGLGFGIYEGMKYQMGTNLNSLNDNADLTTGAAFYYFENLLRLTTLPFLHAMWTAIGAYFLSLGQLYSSRRHGLWAAAIGIPAILHGLHDAFIGTQTWIGLLVDFASVFALMIYLSRSQELEKVLQEEPGAPAPGVSLGS